MNRWDNIESEFQLYANMIGIENALVELNEIMTGDITGAIRSMSSGVDLQYCSQKKRMKREG
jgi:hypothetical protein